MGNDVRFISFIADVTEHSAQQGKDYTTKQRVTLEVNEYMVITLFNAQLCEEE